MAVHHPGEALNQRRMGPDARDLIFGCAVAEAISALWEKVKLIWGLKHEFIHPPAPILTNRGGTLDDSHGVRVSQAESADMGAGKSEVFRRRCRQRGAL